MRLGIPAIGLALCLACSCAGRQEPVELRLRLAPGAEATVRVRVDQTIRQRVGGREVRVVQQTSTVCRLETIEARGDGSTRLDGSWDDIAVTIGLPDATIRFDSREPASATPALARLSRLAGKHFSFVVDRRGNAGEITGLEGLASELAPEDPRTAELLAGLLDAEALESSLSQFFGYYPPGPVVIGESWMLERALPKGMRVRTTIVLAQVSRGSCRLRLSSTIDSKGDAPGGAISGTQRGTLELDLRTGLVTAGRIDQLLDGLIPSPDGPIELSIEGKILIDGRVSGA